MKHFFLLIGLTAVLATSPVGAAEVSPVPEIPRLSLRAGTSVLLGPGNPLFDDQLEISWRHPIAEDHLDIFFRGALLRGANLLKPSLAIGGRWYFLTKGSLQPFVSLQVGTSFASLVTLTPYYGQFQKTGFSSLNPLVSLEIGTDWNWTPNLGATILLQAGYPLLFAPEVALKLSI